MNKGDAVSAVHYAQQADAMGVAWSDNEDSPSKILAAQVAMREMAAARRNPAESRSRDAMARQKLVDARQALAQDKFADAIKLCEQAKACTLVHAFGTPSRHGDGGNPGENERTDVGEPRSAGRHAGWRPSR